ncbi:MAG: GntR family transcriptional regulator [Candidatus Humimicrobiaceae bacterium]
MLNIKSSKKGPGSQAYKKIKLLIIENILKPGNKIIQQKIAGELGISIGMVIQALSLLQNERLVEYLPRRGFFVRNISKKEFSDLLEVRSVLESLAVENLSKNLNEAIKNQLLDFLNKFEAAYKNNDMEGYAELDKKFHYFLIEASGNAYLTDIMNSFNILLLGYIKGFKTEVKISNEHHKQIINLIINGEDEKASAIMNEHFGKAEIFF